MFISATINEVTREIKWDKSQVAAVDGDYAVNGFKLTCLGLDPDYNLTTGTWYAVFTAQDGTSHSNPLTVSGGVITWEFDNNINKGGSGVVKFFLYAVTANTAGKILKRWDSAITDLRVAGTIDYENQEEEAARESEIDRLAGLVTTLTATAATINDVKAVISRITNSSPVVVAAVEDLSGLDTTKYQLAIVRADGYLYLYDGAAWQPGIKYGSYELDTSLKESGKAADAKVVGDKIAEIKEDLSVIQPELEAIHDSVEQLPIGLPEAQKTLIISIMRNALYSTDMSADIDALENAFFADIPATAVTLNKTSVSLEGTESQVALVATAIPLNTTDVIVWTSSNPTIATVDSNGLVTAVATGTCSITATAGTASATCSVTVSMVSIVSIDAVYTQSGTVYTTDSLDSLRDNLVITAHWSNDTTTTVYSYDYTLSGTLTAGISTVTVTYAGCTDTFTVTVTQKDLDSIAYENKSYRDIFMTGNMLTGTDFENGIPTGWNTNAGSPETTDEAYVSASHSLKLFMTSSSGSQISASATAIGWTTESGKTYYDAAKLNCVRFDSGLRFGFFNIAKKNYLSVTTATDGWVTCDKYYTATGPNPAFGDSVFLGATGVSGSNPSNMDGYVDDIVHICLTDLFEVEPNKSVINRLYEEYCALRNGGAV